MPEEEVPATRRITGLGTLKALGHPLRMRLYRALFIARAATASQLAEQADEAVSLVSYHLRKLAEHGLIEPAEGRGADGRERWWQPAAHSLSFHDEDFRDAPEKAAAHTAITRTTFEQHGELYRRYLDQASAWGEAWNSAAFSAAYLPRLTAPELAALTAEIDALVRSYDARARAAEADGDTGGRETVAVHVYGFPVRG